MSLSGQDLPEPIAKSSTQVLRLAGFLGDNQGFHRCHSSVRIRNPEIVTQRTYAEHLSAATSAHLRATVSVRKFVIGIGERHTERGPPILPSHNGFLVLDKAKFAEDLGPGLDLGQVALVEERQLQRP